MPFWSITQEMPVLAQRIIGRSCSTQRKTAWLRCCRTPQAAHQPVYQPSLVMVTKKSGFSCAALSATSGSVSSKQIKRREAQRRIFHREHFRARARA